MPWYKTLATYADKATLDQKNRLEDECSNNGSNFKNNDEIKDNIHFLKDVQVKNFLLRWQIGWA